MGRDIPRYYEVVIKTMTQQQQTEEDATRHIKVLKVQTRAQKERQAREEQEDDRATKESEVVPTALADMGSEDEEELPDQDTTTGLEIPEDQACTQGPDQSQESTTMELEESQDPIGGLEKLDETLFLPQQNQKRQLTRAEKKRDARKIPGLTTS